MTLFDILFLALPVVFLIASVTDFLDGRIYCGIDQLNNACLEWLDGDGNGLVHSYTKKVPREMFRDEYRKLLKVYEKRNSDVVVKCPHNSVIEYMDNHYKLPEAEVVQGL